MIPALIEGGGDKRVYKISTNTSEKIILTRITGWHSAHGFLAESVYGGRRRKRKAECPYSVAILN